MNIKDFLIDNYIWIIVIILITIITIIGFLADKKKGGKKVKTDSPNNQNTNMEQAINNMGPISYQTPIDPMQNQINNNMGMNFNNNLNNTTIEPINPINNLEQSQNIGNFNQQQIPGNSSIPMTINIQQQPQPAENIVSNNNQEPMYQPLSEQTPVIAPQPIPNFGNNQVSMENIVPNNNQELMYQPLPEQTPVISQQSIPNFENSQFSTENAYSQNQEQNINSISNYNNVQIPTPQIQENNNFGGQQTYNQLNTTIPQPINMIPTPQPVNPQPIMPNSVVESPMMQANFNNQGITNGPVPQGMPQQQMNQPINFVYGPQNNNQNI